MTLTQLKGGTSACPNDFHTSYKVVRGQVKENWDGKRNTYFVLRYLSRKVISYF